MSPIYSTKKSRVKGLQPSFGVLEHPFNSSISLISVLKVHLSLPSPLRGGNPTFKKEKP